ncbi:hypothetical protein FOH10_07585 [Nocardia otitidiscaviarum]|uniref:VOC domain-containing protein n=1 Tax=Nocardia otitidiscaviarum TaxID=1823 RepID=A0A516NI85_9NOCA|nr:VOC family protein [Nocardia otitidiscaviarum]MCP9625282.1 VOC family protein [Nocardia otitidiscaviarum]QDP78623.1 hypothetical protein FOH10_07585 [Nocardia otitidiscaviarum]
MRIYRIDHIAQLVPDLAAATRKLEGLFGFRRTSSWDNPEQGVTGVRLTVPGSWGQDWVVIAPSGDGSPLHAALERQGGRPAVHHIGVEVPDLEAARAELHKLGLEPVDGPGWIEASLTPPEDGPGVRFRLRGPGTLALVGDEHATAATPAAATGPTLGIVALDHICQAFRDREVLATWYAELAGFVPVWKTPIDEWPDMADLVLNIPGSAICWEIIQPRGEDSFIDRFLAKNGPGVHHVTFQVAEWDAALAACEHHHTPTFDHDAGVTDGAAWRHTFIHPKHAGGVLVQLFWEERPGVWVRSDKIPANS